MSATQRVLLASLALLAAFALWLATRNPKPPFLPGDATHASFTTPAGTARRAAGRRRRR